MGCRRTGYGRRKAIWSKIAVDFRKIISSHMGLTTAQGGERADMSGEKLYIMTQSKIEKDYGTFR